LSEGRELRGSLKSSNAKFALKPRAAGVGAVDQALGGGGASGNETAWDIPSKGMETKEKRKRRSTLPGSEW